MTDKDFRERVGELKSFEKYLRKMEYDLYKDVCVDNKLNPNKIENLETFKSLCSLFGYTFKW